MTGAKNVIYKKDAIVYNMAYNMSLEPSLEMTMLEEGKFLGTPLFRDRLIRIKTIFKKKITLYNPLNLKFAIKMLLKRASGDEPDEYRIVQDIPDACRAEYCIDYLTKFFLVEQTYLVLGEDYIKNRLRNRLGIFDPNEFKLLKILDFIITHIEENRMARLKKFRENSKFKTFLTVVASRLLCDYWREVYGNEDKKKKYKSDYEERVEPQPANPLDILLEAEDHTFKQRAHNALPGVLRQLNVKETLVYKMKYHHENNPGQIADTLGCSRYKAVQFISRLELKIKTLLLKEIGTLGELEELDKGGRK